MNSYFNLIDEPWIPCYFIEHNKPQNVNLLQVFLNARNIREINALSPLETISMYRLLLVILHSIFRGPKNKKEWYLLWSDGWLEKVVRSYFDSYYNRFYLFDKHHPFYQVPNLLSKDDNKKLGMDYSPIIGLTFDKASGNNQTLWDHNIDDQKNLVSLSTAAKWLVTQQTFNLGGTKSDPNPKDRHPPIHLQQGICIF